MFYLFFPSNNYFQVLRFDFYVNLLLYVCILYILSLAGCVHGSQIGLFWSCFNFLWSYFGSITRCSCFYSSRPWLIRTKFIMNWTISSKILHYHLFSHPTSFGCGFYIHVTCFPSQWEHASQTQSIWHWNLEGLDQLIVLLCFFFIICLMSLLILDFKTCVLKI